VETYTELWGAYFPNAVFENLHILAFMFTHSFCMPCNFICISFNIYVLQIKTPLIHLLNHCFKVKRTTPYFMYLKIKKQMKEVYRKQAQFRQILHNVFYTTKKFRTPFSIPEIRLIKFNNSTCETFIQILAAHSSM